MYKIVGIGKASGTRVTMYIMLSFEKPLKYARVSNGNGQIAPETAGT